MHKRSSMVIVLVNHIYNLGYEKRDVAEQQLLMADQRSNSGLRRRGKKEQ